MRGRGRRALSGIDQTPRPALRPAYRVVLAVLLLMSLASVGIIAGMAGAFTRTLHFQGPFRAEGVSSHLVSVHLPDDTRFRCCVLVLDDSGPRGEASKLRLWVNGVELGPAHTPHVAIRRGEPGFSHWGKEVYFALPMGVQNDSVTRVTVRYPYWFRPRMRVVPAAALALALALIIALHRQRATAWIRSRFKPRPVRVEGQPKRGLGSIAPILSVGGDIALEICALLTVCWLALQLGFAHIDQTFKGPFAAEQIEGSQLKSLAPRPLGGLSCCLEAPSDYIGHGSASQMRLWVNGKEVLPAHMSGADIRQGHPGFSFWGSLVYFSLPKGTENSSRTTLRLTSPLRPVAWTLLIPAITIALFIGLYGRRARAWIKGRAASPSTSVALKVPYLVLFAFGWTVVVAGAAYLATVLWGLVTGEALAPAIPFRSDLGKTLVDALDPAIPPALLLLALFGTASGWMAAWLSNKEALRQADVAGIRWMRRYGLFCLVMFYLASVGATWAGTWRSGASQTALGLVPAFDSWGYFGSAHTFLYTGRMGEMLSRRPLAGVLRVATLGLSDLRFGVVLLWQTLAMAGATFFATMAIMRWRGLWAGVVFMALTYIAIRTHLPTLLTEPLGLPIAIVAFGFLAESLRTSSKGHALLAIGLLTEALWIRPGAVFVIPGLVLWFAWSFHETLGQKLKGFVVACAPVVAVIATDKLAGALFAGHAFQGELAYAFCGLSLGADWSACLTTYPQEYGKLAGNFDAQIAWLNAKAISNIQHDPGVFIHALVREPTLFWTDLSRVLLQGYSTTPVPRFFPSTLWFLAAAVFGALSLRNRNARVEAPLWIMVCLGLTASAIVVYSSDGVRSMAVTYPLLGLFVAAAFSSPVTRPIPSARTVRRDVRLGAILTVGGTAALFLILPVMRLIYPSPKASLPPGESQANTAIVGDLARSTGLLVVADDQPLPHGVPSVHLSRFAEILDLSRFQGGQGIIAPKSPPIPFGFIEMPYLDRAGARILITPPEMVTRRDVHAWRITFGGWNPTGEVNSDNWDHVESATPYVGPITK